MLGGVVANSSLVLGLFAADLPAAEPAFPRTVESNSIESLFQVTSQIYSSGEPRGEAAFEELRRLGIRSVISVDGAQPDVEAARTAGIRYLHVPTGYGLWSRTNQLRLIAAAREALPSGPLLIHCHHGTHRGPTAVAVICMGLLDWPRSQGTNWLGIAGTGTNYAGLFQTVKEFELPQPAELERISTEFPETVEPTELVELMTHMNVTMENVKVLLENRSPDVAHLQSESLLLAEMFRELERLLPTLPQDPDYSDRLSEARIAAEWFHKATRSDTSHLEESFRVLKKSCSACHRAFRD